jgi:hypothetical protein
MARSLRLSGWCEFKDARIWLTLLPRISAANSGPSLFHQKLSRFMADVLMTLPISANDLCKFKATSEFFEVAQTLANYGACRHVFFLGVSMRLADKPLNHTGQGTTIRLCARRPDPRTAASTYGSAPMTASFATRASRWRPLTGKASMLGGNIVNCSKKRGLRSQ